MSHLKWFERPARCLVGLHAWKQHPGIPWFKYCSLCQREEGK